MEQIIKGGKVLNYEVKRTAKKNIIIRIKGELVSVTALKKTPKKTIEKLLCDRFDILYEKTNEAKIGRTVHFGGIAYRAELIHGARNAVFINGDRIIISSTKNDIKSYQRNLWDFYKRAVEDELTKLYFEAEGAFPEIPFPKISVRYMKTRYGHFRKSDNTVKLSSAIAKHDLNFVKLVLYHELSHALEFSHSKRFYRIFESKLPGAISLQKRLKSEKYNDIL